MNIKLSFCQSQVIKAKKKIAEEHMRKAIEAAIQTAESASLNGKTYCISLVDVGSDTAAIREAVVKVMEQKVLSKFLLKLLVTSYLLNYQPLSTCSCHLVL